VRQSAFYSSFEAAHGNSLEVLHRLETQDNLQKMIQPIVEEWRKNAGELAATIRNDDIPSESIFVNTTLARLADLQAMIRHAGQQWLKTQGDNMETELGNQRVQLKLQLLAAVLLAILLSSFIAWWLLKPIQQLEDYILHLGFGLFSTSITIGGPTDFQRLGKHLDWLRQRLLELENNEEEMLRHIEKNLNLSLATLKNNVDLLTEEVPGPLNASQREVANIISERVQHLQRQSTSIRQILVGIFDTRDTQRQHIGLHDLLKLTMESLHDHPRFDRVNKQIDLQCPADTKAWVDTGKVTAVLRHILQNALDFAPEASTITLSAQLDPHNLVLTCHDEGVGVLAEDAPHIFKPFYRGTQSENRTDGTDGISLTIAQELTRIMGGDIKLLPESPGAHFRVTLPRLT
jgi:two-component system sensor histidine kinase GlrK